MAEPLVSVIIPAYNGGPYIAETLESVFAQTYRHWEIIVVDDGSTDDTPKRLEAYRDCIRYIRQENGGVGAARNTGLRVASGDYIGFLDQDDIWLPEKLATQLGIAARHPESGMIACDGIHFEGDLKPIHRLLGGPLAERLLSSSEDTITGFFYREFIQHNPLCCPAQTLIPRAVAVGVGPITTCREENEDWDYTLRIALRYPITLHRHSLVRWRYVPSSGSGIMERRRFTWALRQVPVLRRHETLCPLEDRKIVRQTLVRLARGSGREAYQYGRERDILFAREFLKKLTRFVPEEPMARVFLVRAYLPSRVDELIARGWEGAKSHLRRWGRMVGRFVNGWRWRLAAWTWPIRHWVGLRSHGAWRGEIRPGGRQQGPEGGSRGRP